MSIKDTLDPKLDLFMERSIDVPVELVWKAWTDAAQLKQWFTPAPWTTPECEIDLRPGGKFFTTIESPEGERMSLTGCYLEIEENRKLVWTDALGPEFRPSGEPNHCIDHFFTATLLLASENGGTKYTVIIRHADEEACRKHAERGFPGGWDEALKQLVAMVKKRQEAA